MMFNKEKRRYEVFRMYLQPSEHSFTLCKYNDEPVLYAKSYGGTVPMKQPRIDDIGKLIQYIPQV